MPRYDFSKIEKKWQKKWKEEGTCEPALAKPARPPFYNLMMFPYPSAEGLHVGNMYAFTGSDIYGRMKRMQGWDVFEPIGLDGFGIHSENYALKIGTHPMEQAKISEKRFYEQLEKVGNGFAWEEKLETYDPAYYRWTQWIFVQMWKHGLAYRKKQPVNWCPSCKTVLADEQVIEGKCERCGTVVEKKNLEQWFFKITDYAERLLRGLGGEGHSLIEGKGEFAFRPDKKTEERASVLAIVKHWKKDEYLCLTSKKFGWTTFVVGGVEADEEPKEAAMREIKEETGFKNLRFVKKLGDPVSAKHFAPHKDVNRLAHVEGFYFELIDGEEEPVAEEERNHQEMRWVSKAKMEEALYPKITDWVFWQRLMGLVPVGQGIDWSEKVKIAQRNWIGRSEGINIKSRVKDLHIEFEVFDSVPQTFMAQTFTVIAPEHPVIADLVRGTEREKEVLAAVEEMKKKKASGAYKTEKEFDGIFTGRFVDDPFGTGDLPIWVASYVVMDYGTGIVHCSAHDERDFAFAKKYGIPLRPVMFPPDEALARKVRNREVAYAKDPAGIMEQPGEFRGRKWGEVRDDVIALMEKRGIAKRAVYYRLRDWLISRQRYWGAPIPMIHCESCASAGKGEHADMPGWYAVPEKELPVELPFVENFRPQGKGESPLASVKSFYEVKCPGCKKAARRETDVSDTFLDSAWYFLRYPSIGGSKKQGVGSKDKLPWDPAITKKWLPVNMYIGGAEHSVLHLLYSRFVTMALHDMKLLHFEEPFTKFRAHGLLIKEGAKMSKSKGNVVNPDEYVQKFGADTLRMYLMFLAPFEQGGDFRDASILGLERFLNRAWNISSKFQKPNSEQIPNPKNQNLEAAVHKTIQKVTEDIENLHYNTAISALMILLGEMEKQSSLLSSSLFGTFLKLLAPFAPHMTEEVWRTVLGNKESIHRAEWPEYDPKLLVEDTFTLVIQVNGKVRDTVEGVQVGISEDEARALALSREKVVALTGQVVPRKVIYIPGKIVNIVV